MKPHIDYDDVIYDKTSNKSFWEKLESVQYKIALAITGYIQGTSREKKLWSLESLKSRGWFKRLRCMFKLMKNQASEYLNSLIPKRKQNLTPEISIYQVAIVKESILNLLFSLPYLRNGSTIIQV